MGALLRKDMHEASARSSVYNRPDTPTICPPIAGWYFYPLFLLWHIAPRGAHGIQSWPSCVYKRGRCHPELATVSFRLYFYFYFFFTTCAHLSRTNTIISRNSILLGPIICHEMIRENTPHQASSSYRIQSFFFFYFYRYLNFIFRRNVKKRGKKKRVIQMQLCKSHMWNETKA